MRWFRKMFTEKKGTYYEEVPYNARNVVKIDNPKVSKLSFFVFHDTENKWFHIIETSTGMAFASERTKKEAIERTKVQINRHSEKLKELLKKHKIPTIKNNTMPKRLTEAEKKERERAAKKAKKEAEAARKKARKERENAKNAEKKAKEKDRKAALAAKRAAAAKRQTGSQTASGAKLDKRIKAKKPGKRVSKSGNVYYENRKNRSDINKWL